MKKTFRAVAVLAISLSTAPAETIPMTGWGFGGSGVGTWSGHSTNLSHVSLSCFSAPLFVNSIATSTNSLAIVTSNTTYMVSTSAKVSGPGSGSMGMIVNNSGVAGIAILSTGINVGLSNYSASFTTGGPGDGRVGQPLRIQFEVNSYGSGNGAGGSFNNITLTATKLVPSLQLQRTNQAQVRVSWPAYFSWYALEQANETSPASWTVVTNTPWIEGTNIVVVIEAGADSGMFRLKQ